MMNTAPQHASSAHPLSWWHTFVDHIHKPSRWTAHQFSLVRIILGAYLTLHFASLLPWGVEMFSNQGVIPLAAHSPLIKAFPNLLAWMDDPLYILSVLGTGTLASVGLMLGLKRRVMALLLWYIWAILLGRNPLILNPGIPYVGWMLLCFAAIPSAPAWSMDALKNKDKSTRWHLPSGYITVAWIIMVVGYSYSGLMKLGSLSWIDGTALEHVLQGPLAHTTWLREVLVSQPMCLKLLTWSTLALELFAAPLALIKRLRPVLWWAFIGLHVGILCTINFADLTLGMLMIHLLTWNPSWPAPWKLIKHKKS